MLFGVAFVSECSWFVRYMSIILWISNGINDLRWTSNQSLLSINIKRTRSLYKELELLFRIDVRNVVSRSSRVRTANKITLDFSRPGGSTATGLLKPSIASLVQGV